MKNTLAIFISIISIFIASAQPPQKMSYQVVVRDHNNELVTNQAVGLRISILQDSIGGYIVFAETHTATTNANALATVQIGTGTQLYINSLADIDWAHHDYFLRAEIDPAGGSNYSISGTQQLITVPYAFYAGKAKYTDTAYFAMNTNLSNQIDTVFISNQGNCPVGNNTGDILYWNTSDSAWHIVPVGNAGEFLTLDTNNIPKWQHITANQGILPTVVTDSVSNITNTSAIITGTVTDGGGTPLVVSGICWGTSPNPTLSNSYALVGLGINSFTHQLIGLTGGTIYYVRAFAANSAGVVYGNELTFSSQNQFLCGTNTIKDFDGNVYNTVQIGTQCWTKENYKTTHYSDGTAIALGSGTSSSIAYRYCPNNDCNNVPTYGYLYNWAAVMKGAASSSANPSGVQGICPNEWHVPSDAEWTQLTNYVSSQSGYVCGTASTYIAKSLASTTTWNSNSTNCAVGNTPSNNNATGFSIVGTGWYNGSYGDFNVFTYLTSTTESDATHTWRYYLTNSNPNVTREAGLKVNAWVVRCIKD